MKIRIGVESFDLESATVEAKEIPHETGVVEVVKDNCGLDTDAERIDVRTDADAGERALVCGDVRCYVVFLVAINRLWFRGWGEGWSWVRGVFI